MEDNIFGCFVSSTIGDEKGKLFREYVFGKYNIAQKLKIIKYYNYGNDLKTVLFQFYVNPVEYLLNNINNIEGYRHREKSIGIAIVINDDNFFGKSETQRLEWLKNIMSQRLKSLEKTMKKNNINADIELLALDFIKFWDNNIYVSN